MGNAPLLFVLTQYYVDQDFREVIRVVLQCIYLIPLEFNQSISHNVVLKLCDAACDCRPHCLITLAKSRVRRKTIRTTQPGIC